ncbi:FkbM family methyltransferase [Pseudosulfitobacter pseudonitzschiae]|uniref:FkbM family methyltransferase n=1 Tax=Pseudosulfitobacter pseudonitzschiae TaxID=1402135 RepID=UPI001AFB1E83|nr:FkbM family methyltransferase [Pseudosulfitobacter pseudonitzschiae]MBM1814395.1 FkbM family methyltransferase [Pseudosulfitobacter pseudonitzschiae]MBM1831388.1 FkbM family methyltransferase [Pseudosulfitobacter pseudonitzschiae]MBM1836255.1 FkbM family methyltransferase [Pseudosulfitobacter pseudonitzschiae]MBM1841101.1 FkbM family methyltransferase [Pseudosulfitobacter pseudonitzschiae]MBM1845969.1 FkbM family methyltransferase [Pseudosulfitobacter pseudonitzschiae]
MDGTTDVANTAQPSIKSRGLRFPKAAFMTPAMRTALRKDTYENTLVTACNRTALPEDTVLDIGAGIGAVSATLAKQQNVKMVHAVEANPELATYLTNMFALNGIENASVISGTLGKRKSTVDFHLRKNPALSSLVARDDSPAGTVEKIEVQNARTLMKELSPTVVVIDIQGSEADLIPDLDLSGLRAAVVKLHPKWIGPEGVNAVFAAMMEAGLNYNARGSNGKVVSFRRTWPTA